MLIALISMALLHPGLPIFRYWSYPMTLVGAVPLTLLLLGIALLLSTASTVAPALLFAISMNRVFVREEERMLSATFGAQWERYRSTVRKWL